MLYVQVFDVNQNILYYKFCVHIRQELIDNKRMRICLQPSQVEQFGYLKIALEIRVIEYLCLGSAYFGKSYSSYD